MGISVTGMLRRIVPLTIAGSAVLAGDYSDPETAYRILDQAKGAAGSIPGQALALASYAWPEEETDPGLSFAAREQLVGFGPHGVAAMQHALRHRPETYQADVVSALIEARMPVFGSYSEQYLPALEDAIWYGTADARRLAIIEVTYYKFPPALTSMIDAAYENPELIDVVIASAAAYRDERGRHFLNDMLKTGTPAQRRAAAKALMRVAGRAATQIREAVLMEDDHTRRAAIDALLPIASFDDRTLLHEYYVRFGEQDADVGQRARRRALLLEDMHEFDQAQQAASP
jgi:hypothetical protein